MRNSKFILSAVVAASTILGIGAASAADLAPRYTKAPPPPVVAAAYDWSGFYIGGEGGGEWNTTNGNFYNAPGFFWRTDSKSQGIGGVFGGFQKQWGQFVLGIEGGWDGLGNSFSSTIGGGFGAPCGFVAITESCQSRIRDIGYVGGKVGYAWDRWMVYGTGGYAQARIETQGVFNATGVPFSLAAADHGGWYAGAGVDYAVLDYLILGITYKHYEFDSKQHNCVICFTGPVDFRNVSAKADAVMGRVSFKFNPWPSAVVARY
jgi:outer membrane immunogenic protein